MLLGPAPFHGPPWPLASWLSPSRQAPPCPEPLPKEYVFVAVVVVVVVRGAKVCQWVRPRPHQQDNTRLSAVVVVTRACVGGNIPTYLVKPPPLLGLHTVDKGYCGTDADDREGERPRRPARAHPPPPIPLPRTPLQQDLFLPPDSREKKASPSEPKRKVRPSTAKRDRRRQR